MSYQDPRGRWQKFLTLVQGHGVGLAYFLGSQKELGPALLRGEDLRRLSLPRQLRPRINLLSSSACFSLNLTGADPKHPGGIVPII